MRKREQADIEVRMMTIDEGATYTGRGRTAFRRWAEQRIGELLLACFLLLAIPKASGNQYTSAFSADREKAKSKSETIKEMGYGKNEAADYQQMAKNPDIVRKVIEDATAAGDGARTKKNSGERIPAAVDHSFICFTNRPVMYSIAASISSR